MISDYHYDVIMRNADRLNSSIIYDRDFNYNYFGFKVGIFDLQINRTCHPSEFVTQFCD